MTMTDNESCSYCAEINGYIEKSFFLSEVASTLGIQSRYLFTSNSFIVFPSVGALVPGYLLIAPKRHITAMAYLDRNELFELKQIISELWAMLSTIYDKKIVLMEHGTIYDRCSSGACVNHAHIHMLPTEIMLSKSVDGKKREI